MLKDATAAVVSVPAGVTLDLNGNNLTATEFAAGFAGSHVIDSVGTGVLAAESTSFVSNNNQLPVETDDGVVFETIEFAEDLNLETGKYKFFIKNEAAKTMLDEAIVSGKVVSVDVTVTWTEAAGNGEKVFTFGTELLQQYAGNWDSKMFTLTFVDLTGISNLDCTASVTCNGVTVEA